MTILSASQHRKRTSKNRSSRAGGPSCRAGVLSKNSDRLERVFLSTCKSALSLCEAATHAIEAHHLVCQDSSVCEIYELQSRLRKLLPPIVESLTATLGDPGSGRAVSFLTTLCLFQRQAIGVIQECTEMDLRVQRCLLGQSKRQCSVLLPFQDLIRDLDAKLVQWIEIRSSKDADRALYRRLAEKSFRSLGDVMRGPSLKGLFGKGSRRSSPGARGQSLRSASSVPQHKRQSKSPG